MSLITFAAAIHAFTATTQVTAVYRRSFQLQAKNSTVHAMQKIITCSSNKPVLWNREQRAWLFNLKQGCFPMFLIRWEISWKIPKAFAQHGKNWGRCVRL
jgi:hypothetical protein